jgi:hypothetical protein
MKKLCLSMMLSLFCVIQTEAQDFRIDNVRENLTDLTAARAGVVDRNQRVAALLRFSVRDNKFEFEANLGILRQENITGEVRLYIPEGTKRITVRHPKLGVLRDYTLPVVVKSKTTYDAEIIITNADYLHTLYGRGTIETPKVQQQESPGIEVPVNDEPVALAEEPVKEDKISRDETSKTGLEYSFNKRNEKVIILPTNKVEVYAGVGFNALSTMGPSIHLGLSYKLFSLEGGYVLGIDKVENISFTVKGQTSVSETYDYSSSKLWVKLGFNASGDSRFLVTPQVGVSYNMISGKSKGSSSTSYFKTSNSVSMFGALRFSYEISNGLYVHLTPQYDFAVSSGDVFSFIKKADGKLKAWGEGFGVNAGVIFKL